MNYKIGDLIVYYKNVLRLHKIDNDYYYFTIVKQSSPAWLTKNTDGLYSYPKKIFFHFPLLEDLTDEGKLELL